MAKKSAESMMQDEMEEVDYAEAAAELQRSTEEIEAEKERKRFEREEKKFLKEHERKNKRRERWVGILLLVLTVLISYGIYALSR